MASAQESTQPRRTVIALPGELPDSGGARLLEEISAAISSGARAIELDLSGLKRLDSRGGAWLIRAVRTARAAGARVDLSGAVSYTHVRAQETPEHIVCRLLLDKKNELP